MSDTLNEEMTRVIVEAFDEVQAEEARARGEEPEDSAGTVEPDDTSEGEEAEDETVPAEEVEEAEEEEEVSEEGEEEPDEGESSEEEQAEEVEAEDEPVAFSSDDPEIQAFLARHGGVEEALRDAVERERLLGRQARELGQLREENVGLRTQLEQATLFSENGGYLNPEQQEWVAEAAESENPTVYIQHAVAAQEFDLARAVLDNAQIPAGQAVRISQIIDRAEQLAAPAQQEPEEPLSHATLLNVLGQRYPEMPQYETEMIQTLNALGPEHPLYLMAHSQDFAQAAQGIIGLYEIARAKTATVSSAREKAKRVSRESAQAAREEAVVSSGGASPPAAQGARKDMVMPGLSREALEAELDRVNT